MRYDPTPTHPTSSGLSIINAYLNAWRRMFDYRGVSTRQEYWVFVPLHWIVLFPVLGFLAGAWIFETNALTEALTGLVLLTHGVAAFLASLSLTVRRVRDATGSGWFTLLVLVNQFLILGIAACPARDTRYLDGLMAGYWNVWRKTADYLGVARRVEFWPFTLINLVALVAVVAVGLVYLNSVADSRGAAWFAIALVVVLWLLLLIPWVPLAVRRVRDATGTGWIALVGLIPLGALAILVICLFPTRQASDPAYSGERTAGESQDKAEPAQYDEDDPWARGESGRGER